LGTRLLQLLSKRKQGEKGQQDLGTFGEIGDDISLKISNVKLNINDI
jgi:hypothetical protein